MKYDIISIDKLRPLEQVFPTHYRNLEEMIDKDGFILKAIIADRKNGIILDGSHRYVYFLKRGYKTVPVCLIDYDDENIRVGKILSHRFLIEDEVGISKKECKERSLSGNLFTPRTTRHFFPFRKSDISLPLSQLERGESIDVSHLIATVDINEEIEHNEMYVKEINEEIEIIINYLAEISETKKYLINQVRFMNESKEIAFFPGKFHPPHIGHLLTIMRILPKYRKLIIGVSEHIPENTITNPQNIQDLLKEFFKGSENVEICHIEGTLVEKKNLNGLPDFDVLLSGNQDVLDWAGKQGLRVDFIPRSEGLLCSGTEIREILYENK